MALERFTDENYIPLENKPENSPEELDHIIWYAGSAMLANGDIEKWSRSDDPPTRKWERK